MKYHFKLVVLLIALITILPNTVYAYDYMIRNVAVDMEGDSAIDAREKALNKARRNAYNIVIQRNFKDMVSGNASNPSDSDIASMVDRFEINREKSSKNRYLASVNVAFNERALTGYLGRQSAMQKNQTSNTATNPQYSMPERGNVSMADRQNYSLKIPFTGIRQWVSIQRTLDQIVGYNAVSTHHISTTQAVVDVQYSGSVQQLAMDLQRRSAKLYQTKDISADGKPVYQVQF